MNAAARKERRSTVARRYAGTCSGVTRMSSDDEDLADHFGRTLNWYLRRLARDVCHYFILKTLCHYTAFQFGLNIREVCFCRWRTGPLAIPTFDLALCFSPRDIYYLERKKL